MNIRKILKGVFSMAIIFAPIIALADEMHPPLPPSSQEFSRLKDLVGTWEGTDPHSKESQKLTVEYSLTSGGSALMEKLSVGTPQEMVSIYHDQGGKLMMTHYCMIGNQPRLELKKSSPQKLELSLAKQSGLDSPQKLHMHALTITFQDKDHITQTWTSQENGKDKESTVINLSRVK